MIELVPLICKPDSLGKPLSKVVDAFAPSRDMCGPRTLTLRARRIGRHKWEAFYVRRRWWHRALKIPQLDAGRHTLNSCAGVIPVYNYVRQTEIAVTTELVENDLFGNSAFVVAFGALEKWKAKSLLNCGVRTIHYLTTAPGDGLTIEPDATCVCPWNGGPVRMRAVTPNQSAEANAHRLAYLNQRHHAANDRTIFVGNDVWLTVDELKQQQRAQAAEAFALRAKGLW